MHQNRFNHRPSRDEGISTVLRQHQPVLSRSTPIGQYDNTLGAVSRSLIEVELGSSNHCICFLKLCQFKLLLFPNYK